MQLYGQILGNFPVKHYCRATCFENINFTNCQKLALIEYFMNKFSRMSKHLAVVVDNLTMSRINIFKVLKIFMKFLKFCLFKSKSPPRSISTYLSFAYMYVNDEVCNYRRNSEDVRLDWVVIIHSQEYFSKQEQIKGLLIALMMCMSSCWQQLIHH